MSQHTIDLNLVADELEDVPDGDLYFIRTRLDAMESKMVCNGRMETFYAMCALEEMVNKEIHRRAVGNPKQGLK